MKNPTGDTPWEEEPGAETVRHIDGDKVGVLVSCCKDCTPTGSVNNIYISGMPANQKCFLCKLLKSACKNCLLRGEIIVLQIAKFWVW